MTAKVTILILLAGVPCAVLSTTPYDCEHGCSMNADEMGPQVCGGDEITYWNECIAYCQDIEVASFGACGGSSEAGRTEGSVPTDMDVHAVVTQKEMNRFQEERFRFVGKRDPNTFVFPTEPQVKADSFSLTRREQRPTSGLRLLRITSDGHEFLSEFTSDDIPQNLDSVPPSPPANNARRNLVVIGDDQRVEVGDTMNFPFSAISEMDFGFGISEGGCTGTLISRTSVVTSAHCVFDRSQNAYTSHLRLAPGRYQNADGVTVEPFGLWARDYATVFPEWIDPLTEESKRYDIAVVKYRNMERDDLCEYYFPGDAAGYVGLSLAQVGDTRLKESTLNGYPYNIGDPGKLFSSGKCLNQWMPDPPSFGYHFCDTEPGQSGSAILTSDNYVLGVHSYGYTSSTDTAVRNGAVMLESSIYSYILSSSERNTAMPFCPGTEQPPPTRAPTGLPPRTTCPCDKVNFFLFKILCRILFSGACNGEASTET